MGVLVYESEHASVIPPAKLFKGFILDADNLIPKVAPQAIQSIEILEGDGGPGSVKKVTFGQASQFNYVKHKIDGLDKENCIYSYTIIEGDVIGEVIEKIENEVKIVPSSDGGSIVKSISKYYTKGDFEIKEEQVKAGKEKALGLFKAIETYLLANHDA